MLGRLPSLLAEISGDFFITVASAWIKHQIVSYSSLLIISHIILHRVYGVIYFRTYKTERNIINTSLETWYYISYYLKLHSSQTTVAEAGGQYYVN
jgi:hypothetical protein